MSESQTPNQSKPRLDISPERNENRHYSRYLNSLDRSASVEDREALHKVAVRTNIEQSSSSSLPKLKLNSFDGNPMEWTEWSNMLIATVDKRTIPDSEKMSHLKTLLTSTAKPAISGMGYSGQFYSAAWSILERKFGRPHVIIDRSSRAYERKIKWSLMTQQAWFSFLLLSLILRTSSKSTNKLVICTQVQLCIWQLISYHRYSKNGGSMLMTRTKNHVLKMAIKNGNRAPRLFNV